MIPRRLRPETLAGRTCLRMLALIAALILIWLAFFPTMGLVCPAGRGCGTTLMFLIFLGTHGLLFLGAPFFLGIAIVSGLICWRRGEW